MIKNCGLEALEKIKGIKEVSAATLVNIAKDNNKKLSIFKIPKDKLVLVERPVIFHSKGHFEYVKNGNPLPDLEWTGYIITEKQKCPGGKLVSLKEASTVKGSGVVAAIAIPAIVGAVKTAAVGATIGAATAAITGQDVGRGALSGAKFGAITGGGLGAIGGLAGTTAATGGSLAARGARLLQTGAKFAAARPGLTSGVIGGVKGLAEGGGIRGALVEGAKGFGLQRATGAAEGLVSQFRRASGLAGAAPTGAPALPTPAGATNVTVPGVGSNIPLETSATTGAIQPSGVGIVGTPASRFSLGNIEKFSPELSAKLGEGFRKGGSLTASAAPGTIPQKTSPGIRQGDLTRLGLAAATGLAGSALAPKPSTFEFDPTKEFSILKETLGDTALPAATQKELVTLVNTPLEDLTKQLSFQNDRTFRRINESFDRSIQGLQRAFSSAGQNIRNSSELRDEIRKIEEQRAIALSEAEQELANENLSRGIQAKQFALTQSLQQNQFDDRLALELADVIGQKQALQVAIEQDNFNSFQDIIGQILNIGFGSQ